MDDLEKVETIRTKCNVSYTDAKAALDAADGNVLDAIIWLESQGKTQTTSAHAATESAPADEPSAEMVAAAGRLRKVERKDRLLQEDGQRVGVPQKALPPEPGHQVYRHAPRRDHPQHPHPDSHYVPPVCLGAPRFG